MVLHSSGTYKGLDGSTDFSTGQDAFHLLSEREASECFIWRDLNKFYNLIQVIQVFWVLGIDLVRFKERTLWVIDKQFDIIDVHLFFKLVTFASHQKRMNQSTLKSVSVKLSDSGYESSKPHIDLDNE